MHTPHASSVSGLSLPPATRLLLMGAVAGVLLGWLLPMLLGPPIAGWGPSLRDSPRLSDAVVGAGGLLVYISEAPGTYIGAHLTRALPAEDTVNAVGWGLIGLTGVAFGLAIRRRRPLPVGALAGLLLGWMVPALCQTLAQSFVHCWMHEGLLGTIALAGGTALRSAGLLAELPWRLLAGAAETVTPVLAVPVSAAVWMLIGTVCAAVVATFRQSVGRPGRAPEGARDPDVEVAE